MNNEYIKKENTIRRCIEEGKPYYSSYQMQVIKSKFYTAITFNKEDEEYKKRIDEIYYYAKDTLSKNIDKVKRDEKKKKIKEAKKLKAEKIHNYISKKEENLNERVLSTKDRVPLPPKYKIKDKDFKKINDIYDVRERLLTTDDVYSILLIDNINIPLYINTMIDHAFLNFVASNKLNEKYPKYVESRHEMFDFIKDRISNLDTNGTKFLSDILNDETLLRQFMHEVNPLYFDKESDDYKLIKKEIKSKKNNNSYMKVLSKIESSISNININDEIINSMLKNKDIIKTKTL